MADSPLDFRTIAQPITVDKDQYVAVLFPVKTTAELADVTDRINTVDKFEGKMAYDSSSKEPVFAFGAAAADAWISLGSMLQRIANGEALQPDRTTAQLAAIGDAINTANKRAGKMVFDTTLGQPVWADGATAGSTWSLSTGVVAHTPA